MSKYQPLWDYVIKNENFPLTLTFEETKTILGFEIDHCFLNCKKQLNEYGFEVSKISLKQKTVRFDKII